MADFPGSIYTERETENLPGIVFDATKKSNMFSEDFQRHADEIIALETFLYPISDFAGEGGKILAVNDTEDSLEFIDAPSGGGAPPKSVYSFPFMCGNTLLTQFFSKVGTHLDSQNQGLGLSTGSSANDGAVLNSFPLALNVGSLFLNSPEFGINFLIGGIGTDVEIFLGFGDLSNGVFSGQDWTIKHVGFKIKRVASGAINVYASQADGTTENSSLLFTVSSGYTDYLCLKFKINSGVSVDYYYSKNGAAMSAAVNLTSNLPTSGACPCMFAIGNVSHATASDIWLGSGSVSF